MPSTSIADQVSALVRRSRVGDENAMAMIYRVGQEARKGNPKAARAAAAIEAYAKANPPTPLSIDMPKPVIADPPVAADAGVVVWQDNAEARKPPLPRGALQGVLDPDHFCDVIAGAARYRFGVDAAATVLATGQPLTRGAIESVAEKFDEKPAKIFLYGVSRCTQDDWERAAPAMNGDGRYYLVVGQCFGRARRLQALRQPGSRIGAYSKVAGWELGE